MRTFAVINQKGGSGKTTTAINLAAVWAAAGKRTLLIDVDAQSHCAAGLAIPDEAIESHIGDAMLAPPDQAPNLRHYAWRVSTDLDLVPSAMQLAGLEAAGGGLADRPDRDLRLVNLLQPIAPYYDACVIDCPPAIGLLTYNALRAADEAIIPVETSYFALQGAHRQVNTICSLADRLGKKIRYHLLPTIHRADSKLGSEILAALKNRFVQALTPVVIHFDERLREAAGFGQSIVEYAPGSVGHRDYAAFGAWLDGETEFNIEPATPLVELASGAREALLATVSRSGGLPGVDSVPQRIAPSGRTAIATAPSRSIMGVQNAPASRAAELATRARLLAERSAALQRSREERDADAQLGTDDDSQEIKPQIAKLLGPRITSMGVSFTCDDPHAETMCLAGDFNNWSRWATPMTRYPEHGVWHVCVQLEPGRHQYRFIRDGSWINDPCNECHEPNPFGETNSIVDVPADVAGPAA